MQQQCCCQKNCTMDQKKETGFAIILAATLVIFMTIVAICSCKTSKSSQSVHGKRETVSQSSNRLSSSQVTDSIAKWLQVHADSLVINFADGEQMILLPQSDAFPSPNLRLDDGKASDGNLHAQVHQKKATLPTKVGAHTAHPKPKAIKIYGLHVDASTDKKSVAKSSSKDSTAEAVQSVSYEEEKVKKSSPKFTLIAGIAIAIVIAIGIIILKAKVKDNTT